MATINLRPSKADAALAAINAFMKQTNAVYFRPFTVLPDGTLLELHPDNEGIRLSFINVPDELKGKGVGSKTLDLLSSVADKYGVPITGTVDRQGKSGLTNPQLKSWYGRHGFEFSNKRDFARKPKPVESAARLMVGLLLREAGEKTVAVDFDGVLHGYSEGYKDGEIYDDPVPGAAEAMQKLLDSGYEVVIFSTRNHDRKVDGEKEDNQRDEMAEYLDKHEIPYTRIHKEPGKPLCNLIIDDNCFRFEGDWPGSIDKILSILSAHESQTRDLVDSLFEEEYDEDDAESEAADFVEEVVGHFHFPANWIKHREQYVGQLSTRPNGDAVIAAIDRLAKEGANWTDAYKTHTIELG